MPVRKSGHNYCLLYQQIVDEPIGINCGPFVTITYKSIATVSVLIFIKVQIELNSLGLVLQGLGLWATYIIVTLQLYSTPSEVEPPSYMTTIFQSTQMELI